MPAPADDRRCLPHQFATERVSESVNGAHETRLSGVVADRRPDLGHHVGQARIHQTDARPDGTNEVVLGDCGRHPVEEQRQQLERLGRQVDRLASRRSRRWDRSDTNSPKFVLTLWKPWKTV
jgi:hypothetical protein